MKTPSVFFFSGVVRIWAASSALAQGTFQNLDLEAANVPQIAQGQNGADVAASDGIPGWIPYISGRPKAWSSTIT